MVSSDALRDALLELCWSQWASLGVSAAPAGASLRVVDLEALILLTFEVGRDDPRLFDEALGWLHDNAARLNTNRLRTLATDELDRRLTDAALHWLAAQGRGARRARLGQTTNHTTAANDIELFPGDRPAPDHLDPSFAAHGIVRRLARPSGKIAPPDLLAPACLALRLRAVLGLGVKAELVRALLTIDAPWSDLGVLEASVAYTARSTRDGLAELVRAGVVAEARVSGRGRYAMPRAPWFAALDINAAAPPLHTDWRQLFAACRLLIRWWRTSEDPSASAYLRASAAREIWSRVEPDLRYAGVYLPRVPFSPGEAFLTEFDQSISALTAHVRNVTPR